MVRVKRFRDRTCSLEAALDILARSLKRPGQQGCVEHFVDKCGTLAVFAQREVNLLLDFFECSQSSCVTGPETHLGHCGNFHAEFVDGQLFKPVAVDLLENPCAVVDPHIDAVLLP